MHNIFDGSVEYQGERFGPAPQFEVTTQRESPWGSCPIWADMAWQGRGPFAEWKSRAQLNDEFVRLLYLYQPVYRWPLFHLAAAAGWPDSQRRWLDIARAFPLYPIHVLDLIVQGTITAEEAGRLRVKDVVRKTTALPAAIFRRVIPRDAEVHALRMLEHMLPSLDPNVRKALTCGCRVITLDTILCLSLPQNVLSPALLRATESSRHFDIYELAYKILVLAEGQWVWSHVSAVGALESIFERLKARVVLEPLPPPPFPAGDGMVALTTHAAVATEGIEMNHCLRSLFSSLRSNRYAYALHAPERATILIKRDEKDAGRWALESVVGPANATVDVGTYRHVSEWISRYGGIGW